MRDKPIEEKIADNTDRLEKKLELVKKVTEYICDHSMLLDDKAADTMLKTLQPFLNEFCEACGGAMCNEANHCPVWIYSTAVKNALSGKTKLSSKK